MRYTILRYEPLSGYHYLRDKEGRTYLVDMFVDDSYSPEFLNDHQTIKEQEKICKSLVGKEVDIEELCPLYYYAHNVKF